MDTMDILLTVDTTDGVDITDTPTDTGNVMPKLHPLPLLLPPPMLMPAPSLGTMDTTDIPTDTGAMDTVDTTDTLTDTGGRDLPKNNNQNVNILSNDPLMLMLMPAPNPGTMDTTAIPTDGAVTTEDITDTVIPDTTGVRIISSDPTADHYTHLSCRRHFQIQEIKI